MNPLAARIDRTRTRDARDVRYSPFQGDEVRRFHCTAPVARMRVCDVRGSSHSRTASNSPDAASQPTDHRRESPTSSSDRTQLVLGCRDGISRLFGWLRAGTLVRPVDRADRRPHCIGSGVLSMYRNESEVAMNIHQVVEALQTSSSHVTDPFTLLIADLERADRFLR